MIYSDDEDYEGEIDGIEEVRTANLTRPSQICKYYKMPWLSYINNLGLAE